MNASLILLSSGSRSNLFRFLKVFLGLLWHYGPTFVDVMLILLLFREANKVATLSSGWCHLRSVNSRSVRLGHHLRLICHNGSFWSLSRLFFLSTSAHDLIVVSIWDFQSHVLDVKVGAKLLKVDVVDPPYSNIAVIFAWGCDVGSNSVPLFYLNSRTLLFGIFLDSLHVVGMLLHCLDSFRPHITLILVNVGIVSKVAILGGVNFSLNLEFLGISLHLRLYRMLLFMDLWQRSIFLILWSKHHVVFKRNFIIRVLGREDPHCTWTAWNWKDILLVTCRCY